MRSTWLVARRVLAFFVDWLMFFVLASAFAVYYWQGGVSETTVGRTQFALTWAWLIYFAGFEWLYGATVGKFVFRLAVRQGDGTRLSLRNAVSRTGLTFIVPILLSSYLIPPTAFFERTSLGVKIAMTLVFAPIALVPLSILLFRGQSAPDFLLGTRVLPSAQASIAPYFPTWRRWALLGVSSVFVGICFSWILTQTARLTTGSGNMVQFQNEVLNTLPPELLPHDLTFPGTRATTMGFRGKLARQAHGATGTALSLNLYGTATSYDELLVLKDVASRMAEVPDDERPKCVTVVFRKQFDGVFAIFVRSHYMKVCNVPAGQPYNGTIIDSGVTTTFRGGVNTLELLRALTGDWEIPPIRSR